MLGPCFLCFVFSGLAVILLMKRKLVALLYFVLWLFLAVPWVCLRSGIVAFTGHTHLCFDNSSPTGLR